MGGPLRHCEHTDSLTHGLTLCTMAVVLVFSVSSATALFIRHGHVLPVRTDSPVLAIALPDVEFRERGLSSESDPIKASDAEVTSEVSIPSPQAIPATATFGPLPEVPVMPGKPKARAEQTKSSPKPNTAGGQTTRQGRASATPSTGVARGQMSAAARLAQGRMPAPTYPSSARRSGQTGTVTVEFSVDTAGRVTSVRALKPCRWPLLNEEALRTVRRWIFPPGPAMTLRRPIVFQLR